MEDKVIESNLYLSKKLKDEQTKGDTTERNTPVDGNCSSTRDVSSAQTLKMDNLSVQENNSSGSRKRMKRYPYKSNLMIYIE